MRGVLLTLKKLISSNKSFLCALNKDGSIPDTTIRIELIILYFKINSHYNNQLTNLINEILSGRFTIDEDKIATEDKTITIKELKRIIEEIEQYKQTPSTQIIRFKPSINEKVIRLNRSNKVVSFPFQKRDSKEEINDARKIFSVTMKYDSETRMYVRYVRNHYNQEMSRAIINALKGNIMRLDEQLRNILLSHLNVYPLIYAEQNDLEYISYLELPQSSIGISRIRYANDTINSREKRAKELYWELEKFKALLEYYAADKESSEYNFYQKIVSSLQNQYIEERFTIYRLSQSREIYNRSLIANIDLAIRENSVSVNTKYRDPVITFFTINYLSKEADFHCSMHLSTFQNLVPNAEQEETLKLEKK